MAKGQRGFQYKPRTKEQVKERANMRGGGFDSFLKPKYKIYKVRDGKNIIRILPATWEGANHYGYDIFVNYQIGPDKAAYLSLSKHKKGPDPLADALREAQREGDIELAKQLAPRQRILLWVIDRQEEDEGPQLWPAPFTVDKSFINLCQDEDTGEVVFIDDPDKGFDVRFYRTGKGLNTEYDASRMKLLGPKPISEDENQQNEWLEFIQENPLPDTLHFYSADYISEIFSGAPAKSTSTDDDDDEDEAPTPRKKSRPVSKAPAYGDEGHENEDPKKFATHKPVINVDEDEDDEADDEEESAPPKKAGSLRERIAARRKAAKVEDEDDDE